MIHKRQMECLEDEVSKLIENAAMATNGMSGLGDHQENGDQDASPMQMC